MMITLNTGRKLKVKDTNLHFNKEFHLTKVGFVLGGEVFSSLEEIQLFIEESLIERNTLRSTNAFARVNCLPRQKAWGYRHDWPHCGRINWGSEGGLAVAVKVDSLGKAIEYLSLCDWSNKFGWELPEPNGFLQDQNRVPTTWHYFRW